MLLYLFSHRERPRLFCRRWFIVWIKRCIHFPAISIIIFRKIILNLLGAKVESSAFVGKIDIKGKGKLLTIGAFSSISTAVHLALHDEILIGNCVVINSGAHLLTGTHSLRDPMWPLTSKPIVVCDYAWIATNSIILPGVTIGEGAVVGAGAVVSRNVPPYTIVAGNPAVEVGKRTKSLLYKPVNQCAPFEAWIGKL